MAQVNGHGPVQNLCQWRPAMMRDLHIRATLPTQKKPPNSGGEASFDALRQSFWGGDTKTSEARGNANASEFGIFKV